MVISASPSPVWTVRVREASSTGLRSGSAGDCAGSGVSGAAGAPAARPSGVAESSSGSAKASSTAQTDNRIVRFMGVSPPALDAGKRRV